MTKFSDVKYLDTTWFEMWYSDKKNILSILYHNLNADINAGYNPLGNCIRGQREAIVNYEKSINDTLDMFTNMNDNGKIERWCYHDLLKCGAIE